MSEQIIVGLFIAAASGIGGYTISTIKARRKEITTNTLNSEIMKVDIKYIIKTIDEIKPIPARVTVLEGIVKQILIEIDKIKRGGC
jgi:hypothetical protein